MVNSQLKKSNFDPNVGTLKLQGQLDSLNSLLQKSKSDLAENTKTIEENKQTLEKQKQDIEKNDKTLSEQNKTLKDQGDKIKENNEIITKFNETVAKTRELITNLQKNHKDLEDSTIVSNNEYDALVADIAEAKTKFNLDKESRESFLSDIQQKIVDNEAKIDAQVLVLDVIINTFEEIKKEVDQKLATVATEKAAALEEISQSRNDTNNELKSLRTKISGLYTELQQVQISIENEKKIYKSLFDENRATEKDREDKKTALDARASALDKREEILKQKESNFEATKRKALIEVAHIAEQKQIKLDDELIKRLTN